ncbi:hypothetical protein HELRODRAFT_109933 [Helobdella robusta]|uniref:RRM domain-containing protein n=1 Tax=Helobdella robusta TaxID=6412 RepID=T1EEX5_HELRO|nr:hypothetical protein HELRODRAFT_109933 [Helobdella robusta]ESO08891.1 hypothetical protein HELRODRAFT_109933 [Helobdella robusta]
MADELDIDALLEDAFKKSERNGERSKKSDRKTDDKKKSSDSKKSDDRKRKSEERDGRRKSRDRGNKRRSDDDHDDDRKKRKRSKDNHSDRRRRSKSRSKSRSRDKSRNKDKPKNRGKSRSQDKSKNRDKSRSRDRSKNRDKSGSRDRSRSRDKSRNRDRSRSRDKSKSHRDREREERQREREKEREKEKEEKEKREKERDERRKEREKEREKEKEERKKREEIERGRNVAKLEDDSRRGSRDRRRSSSRGKRDSPEMTVEERDVRTVFCMQLSPRIRPRDLEEFFSSVGKVRDVRLILDNKSHRSKGIAYIEFRDIESVALAIGLSGQKLLGVPIIVQNAHAERNRQASTNQPASVTIGAGGSSPKPPPVPEGPGRLYVGLLHPNITEEMLSGLFEPFGKLLELKLVKDPSSGKSAGYGFITYALTEDAKKAMGQFNGFQLAGKAIKVGFVTEKTTEILTFDAEHPKPTHSTSTGFNLGPTERLQLMAKLAEGTGMQLPAAATTAISASNQAVTPPIATQCFMLSNMFDLKKQNAANWKEELRDDIIEECNKHGGLIHMVIDEASDTGNVYVKCPSVVSAAAVVNALHGRYFAGQVITAAYVPLPNYHTLFPESITSSQLLQPSLLYNNHM